MIHIKKFLVTTIIFVMLSACSTNGNNGSGDSVGAKGNGASGTQEGVDPFNDSILAFEADSLSVSPDEITKENIKGIQQGLKSLGYGLSSVDGIVGKETRSVIKRFQRDFELPIDGEPSQELFAQLNNLNSTKEQEGILTKVTEIQTLLIEKKFLKGKADGIPGEGTRKAISEYQLNNGLAVDGKLTLGVLESLRSQ